MANGSRNPKIVKAVGNFYSGTVEELEAKLKKSTDDTVKFMLRGAIAQAKRAKR